MCPKWNSLKRKQEKNTEISYAQWSEIFLCLEQVYLYTLLFKSVSEEIIELHSSNTDSVFTEEKKVPRVFFFSP